MYWQHILRREGATCLLDSSSSRERFPASRSLDRLLDFLLVILPTILPTFHDIPNVTHSSCIKMPLATDSPSPDPASPTTQPPQTESRSRIVDPVPATEANPSSPQGSTGDDVEKTAADPDESIGDLQDPQGSMSAALKDGAPTEEPNEVAVAKKKRKKRKKAATSMPKNRGTGFEGTECPPQVHLVLEPLVLTRGFEQNSTPTLL